MKYVDMMKEIKEYDLNPVEALVNEVIHTYNSNDKYIYRVLPSCNITWEDLEELARNIRPLGEYTNHYIPRLRSRYIDRVSFDSIKEEQYRKNYNGNYIIKEKYSSFDKYLSFVKRRIMSSNITEFYYYKSQLIERIYKFGLVILTNTIGINNMIKFDSVDENGYGKCIIKMAYHDSDLTKKAQKELGKTIYNNLRRSCIIYQNKNEGYAIEEFLKNCKYSEILSIPLIGSDGLRKIINFCDNHGINLIPDLDSGRI